jgi:guanyl-specific ribonuclease Sa
MSSEANQQVQEKPVAKHQTQELTDLTSFNAFAYATLSDGQTVGVQLTGRHGIPADRMYVDFKEFIKFLDMCAVDSSIKFLEKRAGTYSSEANGKPASSHTESTGDKPSNGSGGSKRNYKDPIPQAELPAELVEVNENVYAADFDYILIKPDLDNKSVVEFWKDDLKFPVGAKMNKWKHDTIVNKLATLELSEPVDPSKPAKIRIAGIQYWSKGGEYEYTKDGVTHTTNYKDLLLVKPIF